ncbi:MAG: response regulator [Nitrospirota bacterium]
MKLLIIDDNPEFRLLIGTQLRSRNITVFGAADIIQAISTAREKRPDVILLDIELPGGDGFLVLQRLKANKWLSAIPVIIVTARDLKGVEEKALQTGAVASLHKPVDIDNLMTVIEQALNTSHQTGGPQPI